MTEFEAWKSEQAAKWLRHIRDLKHDISRLEDEIETMRSLALPQGLDYSKPSVSKSPSDDAIPNAIARLDDMIQTYCTSLVGYLDEKQDASDRIARLNDARYRVVLSMYYINGNSWQEVAEKTHYSIDHCKTLRGQALVCVYEIMPNEWRTRIPRAD